MWRELTHRAYECDESIVPNKSALCDRVLALLQSYHCTGDELLGQMIEVGVSEESERRGNRTRSEWR